MGAADYNLPTTAETGEENDLLKQFDHSMESVRDYTKRYEQQYIRPLLKKCYAYSQERPLSAVFLAFFLSMSAFPVLVFLAVSLVITATFTVTALGVALVAAAAIVLGLLAILTTILVGIFFGALLLAFATISAYFFVRFAVLVRKDGPSTAVSWTSQTLTRLVMGAKKQSLERLEDIRGRPANIKPFSHPEDDRSNPTEPISLAQDDITKVEAEDFSDYAVKEQGE